MSERTRLGGVAAAVAAALVLVGCAALAHPAAAAHQTPTPHATATAHSAAARPSTPSVTQPVSVAVSGPQVGRHAVLTFDDCPYAPWSAYFASPTTPVARTPAAGLRNFEATIATAQRLHTALVIAPTGRCRDLFLSVFHVDIAAYARAHGMWVIGHSYDHHRYPRLSTAGLTYQLEHSVASYWTRPPYGAEDPAVRAVIRRLGHAPWTWTMTTQDFEHRTRAAVVASAVDHCTDGQTCLLHLQWNGFSPAAIAQMITGMQQRGTHGCGLRVDSFGQPVPTRVHWHLLECA